MRFFLGGGVALGVALAAGIFVLAGGLVQGLNAQETGVLTGMVTVWPSSPVEGPGIPARTKPLAGVKLIIYGPEGQEKAAVVSDQEGRYRVELPPGAYRLVMAPGGPRRISKDLPAEITIAPGKETRRDIRVDTGIRGPQKR